ncbi:MAG: hypothetical protein H0T51_11770 [Pirellulales bacterium]|nr:hypothetical protein [Pirellulales bacterium]
MIFEVGEDVAALDLPAGSRASVAVYTHYIHAMAIVGTLATHFSGGENR